MAKFLINESVYNENPEQFDQNMLNLHSSMVAIPELKVMTSGSSHVSVAQMDSLYTSWVKVEKRGRHTKRRHISHIVQLA